MARIGILVFVGVVLVAPATTLAQSPQRYQGVTPEGGEPPSPKAPPPGYQYVTWPGFRVGQGGSEVFLQLTGPVSYKEKRRGNRIYITLDKVQVYLRNNLRRVITRNFPGTPVSSFRLRRVKKLDGLRLDISLRRRAKYSVTTRTAGQYHYLIVSFR